MMEQRLLVGMAGVVLAVLCALTLQVLVDARAPVAAASHGSRP